MPNKKASPKKKSSKKTKPQFNELNPYWQEEIYFKLDHVIRNSNFKSPKEIQLLMTKIDEDQKLLDSLYNKFPKTNEVLAQEIMFQAWEEKSAAKSKKLALEALRVDPDCIDAYFYLATETAKTIANAKENLLKTVLIGKSKWDAHFFEEHSEYIWTIHEVRPYFRSMLELAFVEWEMGNKEESLALFDELLRLNKSDDLEARFEFLNYLLILKRFEEADKLIKRFRLDASPYWYYGKVIISFYLEKNKRLFRTNLLKAFQAYPYCAFLITHPEVIDKELTKLKMANEDPSSKFIELMYVVSSMDVWMAHIDVALEMDVIIRDSQSVN
jgi:tetratricopeptide (TPR) repeat protein